MALLTAVHWDTITPHMRAILETIGQCPFATRFYLAGGTALALRLGHRQSYDLDFFSESDDISEPSREEIIRALLPLGVEVLENVDGNLLLRTNELRIGFFGYGYSLVAPVDTVVNVALASIADIGLMKLDALGSRGSRKDFYDVYAISQEIPLADLLSLGRVKYPYARNFELIALESMILFDNADRDVQPALRVDKSWAQVKEFMNNEARNLGKSWFGKADD